MENQQEQEQEYEYIGLMQIGYLLDKKAEELEAENYDGNEEIIVKTYEEASEICGYWAHGLALYYENQHYIIPFIEKQYLITIQHSDNVKPILNFADFYKNENNISKMVEYLELAIEKYQDSEAMIQLAAFYSTSGLHDYVKEYYFMAIERCKSVPMKKQFLEQRKLFWNENIKLIKYVDDYNWEKDNDIYRKLLSNGRTDDRINIYNNKIRLFTKLNNIMECGICYDIELNIDLKCGHCVCCNCYIITSDAPCPFCRIK